jgi:hypothetical protein
MQTNFNRVSAVELIAAGVALTAGACLWYRHREHNQRELSDIKVSLRAILSRLGETAPIMSAQQEQLRFAMSENEWLRDQLQDKGGLLPSITLVIDIGATRTKFLLQSSDGSVRQLPPQKSAEIWQDAASLGKDKFEPSKACGKLMDYLTGEGVDLDPVSVQRLVFSVPGTVDWTDYRGEGLHVVKNMPSFSPKFRGFDFEVRLRANLMTAAYTLASLAA